MTADPVTLETSDKIAFALHKMNVGGYRHLPILFDGKLAGVISIRDILRYLTERIAARIAACGRISESAVCQLRRQIPRADVSPTLAQLRFSVCSVTRAVLRIEQSIQADRLVFIRRAMSAFEYPLLLHHLRNLKSHDALDRDRLASASRPSSSRKSSKSLPM